MSEKVKSCWHLCSECTETQKENSELREAVQTLREALKYTRLDWMSRSSQSGALGQRKAMQALLATSKFNLTGKE